MFGLGSRKRPSAVAFDVIGTTFPLDPLRPRIVALGLPPASLEGWFAAGLRDAFALAAANDFQPLTKVLEAALDGVLAEQHLSASTAQKAAVLEGMKELDARSGAAEAFALLRDAGVPILALTNGSAPSTKTLLQRAGLEDAVAHIVSIDEVALSKPRAEVYHRAAHVAGVEPEDLALVAAHAWDINGAKAAGLTAAYLSAERPRSPVMREPDVEGATLIECVQGLLAL